MDILYIYKIKIGNKKAKNTIKRRFYYNLNNFIKKRTKLNKIFRSSFYIDEIYEKDIDNFFSEYLDWISIFKAKIISFEYVKQKQETNNTITK